MPDPKAHYHVISTSGTGSTFSAYVYRVPTGKGRMCGENVAFQDHFVSRSAAMSWARKKIKELET